MSETPFEEISHEQLENVREKSYYFGHQSVGNNILDGIADLAMSLNIQNLDDYADSGNPVFLHSQVGRNNYPISKLEDFSQKLSGAVGSNVQVAFLKLCYVDVNENTDVDALFNDYSKTFNQLQTQFPDITFVHFTVPLMSRQKGLKSFIKKIIGRDLYGYEDNLKRQNLNEKIRQQYDIVFDIAVIESTKPDGSRMEHTLNGQTYFSMHPDYTDDGGHLNETGRTKVAGELLRFLSEL